jgi:hypothetical protein
VTQIRRRFCREADFVSGTRMTKAELFGVKKLTPKLPDLNAGPDLGHRFVPAAAVDFITNYRMF